MKMRVGILTSGGDCPGLNATIRGVAKALYQRMGDKVEIIGILNGYDGLINGNYRVMAPDEFSGILTVRRLYSTSQNSFSDASEEEQDFLRQFSFICMLSFDVYLKKQMIERLIDQLPAPDFLKKK